MQEQPGSNGQDGAHPDPWDSLGELWTFGLDVSQGMAARVADLYLESGPSLARMLSSDIEGEVQRLRMDVERITDISLDVFDRGLQLSRRMARDREAAQPAGESVAMRAVPGDVVRADLWVHNVGHKSGRAPALRCTDLVQFDGSRIAGVHTDVVVPTALVEPREGCRCSVTVRVPVDTPSGAYHGLVVAEDPGAQTVRVLLAVTPPEPRERDGR